MTCPACESDNIKAARGNVWQCGRCGSRFSDRELPEAIVRHYFHDQTTQPISGYKKYIKVDAERILEMRKDGKTFTEICAELNTSKSKISRVIREYKEKLCH
jgi:DNA-binding NarL/FixJ family response regulator